MRKHNAAFPRLHVGFNQLSNHSSYTVMCYEGIIEPRSRMHYFEEQILLYQLLQVIVFVSFRAFTLKTKNCGTSSVFHFYRSRVVYLIVDSICGERYCDNNHERFVRDLDVSWCSWHT